MKHLKRFNESEENKVKEQEMGFDSKSLIDDETVGFKTSVEDSEKDEKEFKKELDKVEKFESFSNQSLISEKLKYHLDNNKSIVENVFRPGSNSFLNLIKEARTFFDRGQIELSKQDKELFESTDIGKFEKFNGELVPLDLPMEYIEDINEAEYKGKEVKLNHPMRSSGPKKYKVYVKDPKTGNVKVVHFGDVKGGLTAKVSDPKARARFSSRMNCPAKKDKMTPGYWSCRLTKYGHLWNGHTYPGYW
jgi:hypothetical protein